MGNETEDTLARVQDDLDSVPADWEDARIDVKALREIVKELRWRRDEDTRVEISLANLLQPADWYDGRYGPWTIDNSLTALSLLCREHNQAMSELVALQGQDRALRLSRDFYEEAFARLRQKLAKQG